MKLFLPVFLVMLVATSATSVLAQQPPPPVFTYYRQAEPADPGASRAYTVAVDDSGLGLAAGDAWVDLDD